MQTITLSPAARALLQRRLEGEWIEVTDESRPLYRELVEVGLMMPLHSYARGKEGTYRLTDAACALRERLAGATGPEISVCIC